MRLAPLGLALCLAAAACSAGESPGTTEAMPSTTQSEASTTTGAQLAAPFYLIEPGFQAPAGTNQSDILQSVEAWNRYLAAGHEGCRIQGLDVNLILGLTRLCVDWGFRGYEDAVVAAFLAGDGTGLTREFAVDLVRSTRSLSTIDPGHFSYEFGIGTAHPDQPFLDALTLSDDVASFRVVTGWTYRSANSGNGASVGNFGEDEIVVEYLKIPLVESTTGEPTFIWVVSDTSRTP